MSNVILYFIVGACITIGVEETYIPARAEHYAAEQLGGISASCLTDTEFALCSVMFPDKQTKLLVCDRKSFDYFWCLKNETTP